VKPVRCTNQFYNRSYDLICKSARHRWRLYHFLIPTDAWRWRNGTESPAEIRNTSTQTNKSGMVLRVVPCADMEQLWPLQPYTHRSSTGSRVSVKMFCRMIRITQQAVTHLNVGPMGFRPTRATAETENSVSAAQHACIHVHRCRPLHWVLVPTCSWPLARPHQPVCHTIQQRNPAWRTNNMTHLGARKHITCTARGTNRAVALRARGVHVWQHLHTQPWPRFMPITTEKPDKISIRPLHQAAISILCHKDSTTAPTAATHMTRSATSPAEPNHHPRPTGADDVS
jgi:hypothetical protein